MDEPTTGHRSKAEVKGDIEGCKARIAKLDEDLGRLQADHHYTEEQIAKRTEELNAINAEVDKLARKRRQEEARLANLETELSSST